MNYLRRQKSGTLRDHSLICLSGSVIEFHATENRDLMEQTK